jgi:signal transduction histidine kinase
LSIRNQILFFLVVCFLIVIGVLGMGLYTLRNADYTLERIRIANHQLVAMMELNAASNRHSEQIAEHLILGGRQRADLDSARIDLAESLGRLRRLIEEEAALVADSAERAEEVRELELVEAMRSKFAETDRVADQIVSLRDSGQTAAAMAMFGDRIEDGLDDELEQLVEEGIAGESQEVALAEWAALSLSRRLAWTMVGLSLLCLVSAAVAGYFLYRSIAAPLGLLTRGTQAIARGELGYRIKTLKGTEFAFLASQFDQMSEELERKHQGLLAARDDLERTVDLRTRDLHEANRRLVELDGQRVRFLTDASHELRTPLTVIRGEADVALRSRSRSQQPSRHALERIAAQAEDMGKLVDDLLFMARSESDDARFETARIDPAAIVNDAVAGIAPLARRRGVELTLANNDEATPVMGDPRRLKQAVTIILENAIKYSPARSRIDVGIGHDEVGDAVIAVRDAGMGIPADELPRIFDRFFRGEAARAESGGSGLGLTIARAIVEKHGGRIEVASAVGQGTEARLILPAGAPQA